jgi:hypothetical protein
VEHAFAKIMKSGSTYRLVIYKGSFRIYSRHPKDRGNGLRHQGPSCWRKDTLRAGLSLVCLTQLFSHEKNRIYNENL